MIDIPGMKDEMRRPNDAFSRCSQIVKERDGTKLIQVLDKRVYAAIYFESQNIHN